MKSSWQNRFRCSNNDIIYLKCFRIKITTQFAFTRHIQWNSIKYIRITAIEFDSYFTNGNGNKIIKYFLLQTRFDPSICELFHLCKCVWLRYADIHFLATAFANIFRKQCKYLTNNCVPHRAFWSINFKMISNAINIYTSKRGQFLWLNVFGLWHSVRNSSVAILWKELKFN